MAKLEQTVYGDFNQILNKIQTGILNGSMSASLEESSDFESGNARCSVRVFERYSWSGSNHREEVRKWLFSNIAINLFIIKNMEMVTRLFFYMAIQLLLKCSNSSCRCMQKNLGVF